MEQLDESVAMLDVKLDEGVLKKLDAIFPGPGGAAPEAYAW
jgi:aryl-alcohol dehydrogenase-like predicted oxidoreductase